MQRKGFLLLILSILICHDLAVAEAPVSAATIPSREASGSVTALCVNDKAGLKQLHKMDIVDTLNLSKDPLVLAYRKTKEPNKTAATTNPPACTTCLTNNLSPWNSVRSIVAWSKETLHLASPAADIKKIKKECIEASIQRTPGNTGYVCGPGNAKARAFDNAGDSAPCLDQSSVDYMHFAINEALKCFAAEFKPIDTRFILKKYNNETAFNFFLSYGGGKGLGQLTSAPTLDIGGGNAEYILKDIVNSESPACEPFKNVAKNDLKNGPPRLASSANVCAWVSPGEGLTRNLIYSLGYYVHLRDKFILPVLRRRAPALANNSGLADDFTLISYGPDGLKEAKSLMDALKVSDKSNPDKIRLELEKNNDYYQQTEQKMSELQDFLESPLPLKKPSAKTKSQMRGDTCVY
ncbi:MAG: hypothetical protein HUU57_07835 [Bdellovibrio sp.]|nr:hypothetical protein [Bdellovibrio sp.]